MWEKVSEAGVARQWRGDIPVHHRYTLGVAGERFFRAMRDERRLFASRCSNFREAFLPPKLYCERCFEEIEEWTPVDEPAYVKSFTVLHLSLDEEPLTEPVVAALVGWQHIRGGLLHRIGGIKSEEVRLGMAVEPVWALERSGTLADILHFQPRATI